MHYIRFLKHPSVAQDSKRALEIRALITLTSDLGESTYPDDAQLTASLIDATSNHQTLQQLPLEWKANSHALPVVFATPTKVLIKATVLQITVEAQHSGTSTATPATAPECILVLPHILSVASAPFSFSQSSSIAKTLTQRPIPLYANTTAFAVNEDTGPSIDRHVWDAGVGLAALFSWLVLPTTQTLHLKLLAECIRKSDTLRALELGTGVGLVGLALAHVRHAQHHGRTEMALTDVESAQPIAEHNAAQVLSSIGAAPADVSVAFAPLDWEAALPTGIAAQVFDLVLVSDCTYNPDSGPALVRTLMELARRSPGLLVVVASKTRHESEAVFWDRMQSAGFRVSDHARLLARGGVDDDAVAADEVVDVHLFTYE